MRLWRWRWRVIGHDYAMSRRSLRATATPIRCSIPTDFVVVSRWPTARCGKSGRQGRNLRVLAGTRSDSGCLVERIIRLLNAFCPVRVALPIDSSATMPSQEPDRSAEAVRRVLPDLCKLDRYERRAAAQRERAMLGRKKF